jgi:elongation factor 2
MESPLKRASVEGLKSIVLINKLDRASVELQLDDQSYYQMCSRILEVANSNLSEGELSPSDGQVIFGSGINSRFFRLISTGLHGWGFTLSNFARMYAEKFGVPEEKLVKKLWGSHYFDIGAKKWIESNIGINKTPLREGFVQFVAQPINKLFQACMTNDKKILDAMLSAIHVTLNEEEKKLTGRHLAAAVLRKWLPLDRVIFEAIKKFPSPVESQKSKVELLYRGIKIFLFPFLQKRTQTG